MTPVARERSIRVRVSDEEREMLHALAESDGVSASDYVRLSIRKDYAERFGGKPPKNKKTKR